MALDLVRQDKKIWSGSTSFSDKVNRLVDKCINELLNCGVPVNEKICYFVLNNGVWDLNVSTKYLGYLDETGKDKVFKDLISCLEAEVSKDIIGIVFPNSVGDCPYKAFTVIVDEVSLNNFEDFVKNNVRVLAHNGNRIAESLGNYCFSRGNSGELMRMMKNSGSAKQMAFDLNRSKFGWTTWEPVEDSYVRMVIRGTDSWGNKHYIRVVL